MVHTACPKTFMTFSITAVLTRKKFATIYFWILCK